MADDDLELDIAMAAARASKGRKSLGQRFSENLFGDGDPNTQNFGEKVGTALNMAGEAMTAGLVGDEASAAVESVIPGVNYEDRRDHYREEQRVLEDENPAVALASQVSGGMMAPLAAASSLPAALALGAGAGGAYGFMEGEGGFANRASGGAVGAGFGALGGAAAIPVGKVAGWAAKKGGRALRTVFTNRRMYNNGDLTDEGRSTLRALGYDLDELSDDFRRQFAEQYAELADPQQAAAAADMGEFNIPAYRHNVTGTAEDFATFERARRGAMGETLEGRMRAAGDRQDTAMREAGEQIATRMGGGARGDQLDAAVATQEALRRTRDQSLNRARGAYDDLSQMGGGIRGRAVQDMGRGIRTEIERGGFQLGDSRTPNAIGALEELDSMFRRADQGSVPFMELERARQMLQRYGRTARRGANEADSAAVGRVIETFDNRVDDLMTTAMIEGDADALQSAAQNARGLWREYSQQFTGDGATSKFIQKMIDEDASPDDVSRWLFSSGKLGTGRFNSNLARGLKDTLGEGSDEWGMIRQAAFRQLTQKPNSEGVQWGPQAISEKIGEFLNSPSTRGMAKEIYTPEQIAQMRRYAGALKRMVAPDGAVNYSGTAYENARNVRNAFNMLATTLGGGSGGLAGAAIGGGASRAVTSGSDWLTGQSLLRAAGKPITAQTGDFVAGGVAAGGNMGAALGEPLRMTLTDPGNQRRNSQ